MEFSNLPKHRKEQLAQLTTGTSRIVLSLLMGLFGVGLIWSIDGALPPAQEFSEFSEVLPDVPWDYELFEGVDYANPATTEQVAYGRRLIMETADYLGPNSNMPFAGNNLDCNSCHLDGGTKPFAAPFVTVPSQFPQFRNRENKEGTIQERINGCMQRSMNGRPLPEDSEENFEFLNEVVGGRIPKEYIPSVEKGFRFSMDKGPIAGFPIVRVKATLSDGSYHDVDSSDMAFQVCARTGFREAFLKTKPVLLEPIMKLEVEVPADFQGAVTGELNKRRGLIVSTETVGNSSTIIAEVPLAETFGYSTDLRSLTQGQGVFSMEFSKYRPMPANVQREVVEERKQAELAAAK